MINKISVVVITYNRASQLKRCLDSLVTQNYPKKKFFVLVVDDGSRDETKEIVKSYKKMLAINYFYKKHEGAGAARKFAMEVARTRYVAFIDDDCVAARNWLRQLIRILPDKKIAAWGGQIKIQEARNNFERYLNEHLFGNGQNWRPTVTDPPFITTANSLFRRDVIKNIGNFDSKILIGEDLDLGWRLFFAGFDFAFLPKAIVYHDPPGNFYLHLKKIFSYGYGNFRVCKKNNKKIAEYRHNPPYSVVRNERKKLIGFWPHFWELISNIAFRAGFLYGKIRNE